MMLNDIVKNLLKEVSGIAEILQMLHLTSATTAKSEGQTFHRKY